MTKSTDSLEGMIFDWGRAKTIHQFFDELEDAIALSPEEDKALLYDRLRSARDFTRIPNVLEALKDWKTPEEIYDAKKKHG